MTKCPVVCAMLPLAPHLLLLLLFSPFSLCLEFHKIETISEYSIEEGSLEADAVKEMMEEEEQEFHIKLKSLYAAEDMHAQEEKEEEKRKQERQKSMNYDMAGFFLPFKKLDKFIDGKPISEDGALGGSTTQFPWPSIQVTQSEESAPTESSFQASETTTRAFSAPSTEDMNNMNKLPDYNRGNSDSFNALAGANEKKDDNGLIQFHEEESSNSVNEDNERKDSAFNSMGAANEKKEESSNSIVNTNEQKSGSFNNMVGANENREDMSHNIGEANERKDEIFNRMDGLTEKKEDTFNSINGFNEKKEDAFNNNGGANENRDETLNNMDGDNERKEETFNRMVGFGEKKEGSTSNTAGANKMPKKTMKEFMEEESVYPRFPTSPAATRRTFEHKGDFKEEEIALLARKKLAGLPGEGDVCQPKPFCNKEDKYRTFDGTCNSLSQPLKGAKNSPYIRVLEPAYGDKSSLPRGVASYSPTKGYISNLPSPRLISDSIMTQGENENLTESDVNTHMVMQWGQMVDHDIISTSKSAFDCCNEEIKNLPRCFSIPIPETDSFFANFSKTCLDFTRADTHCRKGRAWAEQFNKQTSFLDGSAIYGCHKDLALTLRGGSKRKEGKLLGNSMIPHFLPSKFDLNMHTSPLDLSTDFVAGDDRSMTQAGITTLQNLLFQEHNRIAGQLFNALKGKLNDEELDELVYQETRRLVVASVQHITYSEFLPAVIGEEQIGRRGIGHEDCTYEESTEPGIINSFATAAYRFGHSLVQSIFRGTNQPWRLGKFYSDARFAFKDNGHGYVNELEGLSQQPCQRADLHMSSQLSTKLYCNKEACDKEAGREGAGHDLVSMNIQRGRDHGIPGYNKLRVHCGLSPLSGMDSKPQEIDSENWEKLKSVYKSVDDIDLYVGGLAETPVTGGLVGPTFAHLIGTQFKALMDGDRFFYRHTSGPNIRPLTGTMLEQIRQRRLSDMICENTDLVNLANNVFVLPGQGNPKLPCSSHKKLDVMAIAQQILREF